jgi:CHAD domain-containing protein
MAFRIKKQEPIGKALRRISRECLDKAVEKVAERNDRHALHSTRKEIKKLRALLRLSRAGLSHRAYRKHNTALRDAAQFLAAARDAQVRVQTFDHIVQEPERSANGHFTSTRRVLQKRCKKESRRLKEDGGRKLAREILQSERRKLGHLKVKHTGWKAVGAALEETYGAAQAAFHAAASSSSAEHLHEWRKPVKRLWYYAQLLRPIDPERLTALARDLETLGEQLGGHHDLHVLEQEMLPSPSRGEVQADTRTILKSIRARQNRLRGSSLRLGNRLFQRTPEEFAASFHAPWKLWRSKT